MITIQINGGGGVETRGEKGSSGVRQISSRPTKTSRPENQLIFNPKTIRAVKSKIFREIETKLFETRINNTQLNAFLVKNKKKHAEWFTYDYPSDTNLSNLRFCIFLLVEELNSAVENMGDPNFKFAVDLDAKIEKRNNIIRYLLKEKVSVGNILVKALGCFENADVFVGDMSRILAGILRSF